ADVSRARPVDAGQILADRIAWFMRTLKTPNGLSEIGYASSDIPALVEGTLPQHRGTKLSPRPAGCAQLGELFEDSMRIWWSRTRTYRGACGRVIVGAIEGAIRRSTCDCYINMDSVAYGWYAAGPGSASKYRDNP